jgi:hypothetical protein
VVNAFFENVHIDLSCRSADQLKRPKPGGPGRRLRAASVKVFFDTVN